MANESKTQQVATGGFPFASILTLIFVIAKLAGYFPYSWWIVFTPIWVPLVAILGVLAIVSIVCIIAALFS